MDSAPGRGVRASGPPDDSALRPRRGLVSGIGGVEPTLHLLALDIESLQEGRDVYADRVVRRCQPPRQRRARRLALPAFWAAATAWALERTLDGGSHLRKETPNPTDQLVVVPAVSSAAKPVTAASDHLDDMGYLLRRGLLPAHQ